MARRVSRSSSARNVNTSTPNATATAAASRPTRSSRNSDAAALATPIAIESPAPQAKSLRSRQRRAPEPDPPTSPQADNDEPTPGSDEPMPDADEATPPAAAGDEDNDDDDEHSEATADADDGPTTGQNSDDAAGEAEDEDGNTGEIEAGRPSNPSTPYGEQTVPVRGRGSRGRRGRGGRSLMDWGTPRSPAAGTGDEASEVGVTPVVKRRRGRPPVNGVSSHTPRSARGGGFRGRPRGRGSHSQAAVHAIDKEGNTLPIVGDEVAAPPDPEGEQKVDVNGNLLGGREYRVRTFPLAGRGDRLYMLSTEPARCTGYRDSYLFFTKHLPLHKIIIEEHEKHDLIDRELIPHSYKGRAIGVVTARSVFREFGSKIVVGGKKVIDDYYAQKSRDRGDVEGELADPFDRLPPNGQPYNKNQYVAWHGASQVYHSQQGGAPGTGAPGMAGGLGGKRKPVITSANWMYEHALAASRFNSSIIEARKQSTRDGVYDPHTNLVHYPRAMQPTRVRWEYVDNDATSATTSLQAAASGAKRSFAELFNGESSGVNGETLSRHKAANATEATNGTLTPPDSSHGDSDGSNAARYYEDSVDSQVGDADVHEHEHEHEQDKERHSNKRSKLEHVEFNSDTSHTPFRTDTTIFPTPSRVLQNNFLVVDTHLVAAPPSLTTASVPNSDFCGDVQSTLPDPHDPAYADLPEDCRQELIDAIRREREWRDAWLHAPFASLSSSSASSAPSSYSSSFSSLAAAAALSTTTKTMSMTQANGVVGNSSESSSAAGVGSGGGGANSWDRRVTKEEQGAEEGTSEAVWANFKSVSGRAGMLRCLGLFL